MVKKVDGVSVSQQIICSDFCSGIYLVKIFTTEGVLIERISKN